MRQASVTHCIPETPGTMTPWFASTSAVLSQLSTPRCGRLSVGTFPTWARAPRRLQSVTRAGACAIDVDDVVGMGRLVGDGFYSFIVDVVVHPAHQGRGIGRRLMVALLGLASDVTLTGKVSLVATPDVVGFYQRLGFEITGSSLLTRSLD